MPWPKIWRGRATWCREVTFCMWTKQGCSVSRNSISAEWTERAAHRMRLKKKKDWRYRRMCRRTTNRLPTRSCIAIFLTRILWSNYCWQPAMPMELSKENATRFISRSLPTCATSATSMPTCCSKCCLTLVCLSKSVVRYWLPLLVVRVNRKCRWFCKEQSQYASVMPSMHTTRKRWRRRWSWNQLLSHYRNYRVCSNSSAADYRLTIVRLWLLLRFLYWEHLPPIFDSITWICKSNRFRSSRA